jgi:hypothetical protein
VQSRAPWFRPGDRVGRPGGAAIGAVVAGLVFQSGWAFLVALVVLVGLNLQAGNIRPSTRRR